jgi:hypothetical protein
VSLLTVDIVPRKRKIDLLLCQIAHVRSKIMTEGKECQKTLEWKGRKEREDTRSETQSPTAIIPDVKNLQRQIKHEEQLNGHFVAL